MFYELGKNHKPKTIVPTLYPNIMTNEELSNYPIALFYPEQSAWIYGTTQKLNAITEQNLMIQVEIKDDTKVYTQGSGQSISDAKSLQGICGFLVGSDMPTSMLRIEVYNEEMTKMLVAGEDLKHPPNLWFNHNPIGNQTLFNFTKLSDVRWNWGNGTATQKFYVRFININEQKASPMKKVIVEYQYFETPFW